MEVIDYVFTYVGFAHQDDELIKTTGFKSVEVDIIAV